MLLSLRSNPQIGKPYIHEYDGLCTSTGYHMPSAYSSIYGSPFLIEIDDNLTIVGLSFVLFQGQMEDSKSVSCSNIDNLLSSQDLIVLGSIYSLQKCIEESF